MKILKRLSQALLIATAFGAVSTSYAQSNGVSFPDISRTYLKTGDFVDVDHIKNVGIGQTRQQIMLILGNPHFNEGIGSPDTFNYVFNFYTNAKKGQYITCQYQVTFNDKHLSSGTYWKDKQCEDFVYANPVAAPAIVAKAPELLTLAADGLFAFGKSGINDLQEQGRNQIQAFASQMLSAQNKNRSIQVVGYTDRIGSPASNMILSLNRANTIKQYLVNLGVNEQSITTSGKGASNPVVTCQGAKSPAVVQCLMPNRRIELTVK